MRIAAVALAFFVVASPSLASSPPASQSLEAQSDAVTDWLARFTAWAMGYLDLYQANVETGGYLLDGAEALALKLDPKNPRQAREWAGQWAPQARARLAAERTRYEGLSVQMPAVPAQIRFSPEQRQAMAHNSAFADQIGSMLVRNWQAADQYISALEASTGGSEADLIRIDDARMGLMISQYEAESAYLGARVQQTTGPMRPFLLGSIETNKAMVAWLNNNRLRFIGQPDDVEATARTMRDHAARIRLFAGEIATETRVKQREFASEPGIMQTEMGTMMSQLLSTFADSQAIELSIADGIDDLAASSLTEDEADDLVAARALEGQIQRRVDLDARRRQIILAAGN